MYNTEDLARASRTTLKGIRVWHAQGLLGEVPRNSLGRRQFDEDHMQRAKIIAAGQMAGMTNGEIRAMLSNWNDGERLAFADRILDATNFMRSAIISEMGFDL